MPNQKMVYLRGDLVIHPEKNMVFANVHVVCADDYDSVPWADVVSDFIDTFYQAEGDQIHLCKIRGGSQDGKGLLIWCGNIDPTKIDGWTVGCINQMRLDWKTMKIVCGNKSFFKPVCACISA
jgi:hypothetical protein